MNHSPYGIALAEAVADYVLQGGAIMDIHAHYSGMGLEYSGGLFRYGPVVDGGLMEHLTQTWDDRRQFVAWLARQSDYTMHGTGPDAGNQRLTRARLEVAIGNRDR